VNYAHPIVETVSDSIGRRAFYTQHLAEFQAGAAAKAGAMLGGKTILDPAVIAQGMQNIENSFNGFTARHSGEWGGAAPDQRGGYLSLHRGQIERPGRQCRRQLFAVFKKVGSRDAQLKFANDDPHRGAKTAQAAYDYLWVPPTWAVSAGANYTAVLARCRPVSRSI